MFHARSRITSIALLLAFASVSPLSLAGLKDQAPQGVKLDGTQWQLDPYNSDDPAEAIERAGRKARDASSAPRTGGGIFGGDDPLGRRGAGDPIGGDPVGGARAGRFPSDRGSGSRWPSDRGTGPADIDPAGGGGTVTMQWGGRRGSIFFEALRTNPEKLSFSEGNQHVTVTADGVETDCTAGVKEPFSDSYGDGERTCGWSGRAWVVEPKRGKQFRRTDRYELSRDGRTLRYTTSATEEGMGRVTIARRYQIPIEK
jgi:hypothetical protein